MKDDILYLVHILTCISRVQHYVLEGQDSFMESTLISDAVIRNLQVLGESARRLSEETKASRSEVNWRGIIGFRNVMVHNYLDITLARVWDVVELQLPVLKDQIETMLQNLEESP